MSTYAEECLRTDWGKVFVCRTGRRRKKEVDDDNGDDDDDEDDDEDDDDVDVDVDVDVDSFVFGGIVDDFDDELWSKRGSKTPL